MDAINNQIELLLNVILDCKGYWCVVLWERGLLDPLNLNQYTMDGPKDHFRIHQRTYSRKHILSNCKDFQEKEELLQTMVQKIGVMVDRTPKCHGELAGEEIEYSWGCTKNYYHRLPIKEKKMKETFKQTIRKSTCSKENFSIHRMRAFSRPAGQYMLAYYTMLHQQQQQQGNKGIQDMT